MSEGSLVFESESAQAGFTIMPNIVLRDPTIPSRAKVLYMLLLNHAREKDTCFPGQGTLAALLDDGVSDRQVRTHMAQLEEVDLIRREQRGRGHSCRYVIRDIAAFKPGSSVPGRDPVKPGSGVPPSPEAVFRHKEKHSKEKVVQPSASQPARGQASNEGEQGSLGALGYPPHIAGKLPSVMKLLNEARRAKKVRAVVSEVSVAKTISDFPAVDAEAVARDAAHWIQHGTSRQVKNVHSTFRTFMSRVAKEPPDKQAKADAKAERAKRGLAALDRAKAGPQFDVESTAREVA